MLALNIYDTFYQRSGAQWKGIGQAKAVVFFVLVASSSRSFSSIATRTQGGAAVMAKYHDGAVSGSRRIMDVLLTVLLGVLCVVWLYPVLLILINSLKDELAISTATVFELPTSATFAGLHNYVYGITQLNFLQSFGYSAIITVSSVLLILLCCSMCGWYITRVTSAISKAMYLLCVFSMVVPFQMVMFTLSKTADTLKLNTPVQHLRHLPRLRRGSGGVHVHGLHEVRPDRD